MSMTLENAYNECLEVMYGLRRFGIKLGLETIGQMLGGLGNPHGQFKSIHVAGSNGKGSVASALSRILHEAGYQVGLYTSPHLVRFNERICVNNIPVSDEDVVECCEIVKNLPHGDRSPTFFEYTTAMAFYEFARHGVDWAVIETGMGGRMDATNVVSPALSIISNISLEHQMYLGDTLEQIAGEKGGIIKGEVPVVAGAKQKNVIEVLRAIAGKKSAPFYLMGEDFQVRPDNDDTFTYFGLENTWHNMVTGLAGAYQMDNAALVLAACEILSRKDIRVSPDHIRNGLLQNQWPGRLEVVSRSPFILLDGAHNLAAARNLAEFLRDNMADRKITLVVGILDDKPYADMLRDMLQVCDRAIITRPKIDRSLKPEILSDVAGKIIRDVKIIPSVGEAVEYAIETAAPDELICIAGSLYVVGEAKEELEKRA